MFKLQMRTMDLFLLLGLILTGAPRAADGHESVNVTVAQGQDVILPCSVSTKDLDYFEWKKEDKDEVFFYQRGEPFGNDHAGQHKDFNGRVFHFKEELKDGNISIRITNTQKKDSGAYSCYSPQQVQRCHVQLEVACHLKDRTAEIPGVCPEPHFTEISMALLQCKVRGVSPELQLQIKDSSGTVLPAQRTQSPVNKGSIDIVLQTNVTKSDDYTCVATQEDICHQISSTTSVFLPGVCPEPQLTVNKQYQLQCKVRGVSPELQLELKDSSGTVLHATRTESPVDGGAIDIVIRADATRSDDYSCVATQEDICDQIASNIYVHGRDSTPSQGTVSLVVICVLLGVFVVVLAVALICVLRRQSGRGPSKDSSERTADESAPMSP